MVKVGIIDPVKVIGIALTNAAMSLIFSPFTKGILSFAIKKSMIRSPK
jgi:hypothetical protein